MVIVCNDKGKALLNEGEELGSKEIYFRCARLKSTSVKEEGITRKNLFPNKTHFYYA